ncbi:MAG: response regulator [Methylococcales bacterium]|nr:response regulator [Methylococcales bacterium]
MNDNTTILIIDDDEISLLIMQNAFEMEGYTVITTTNSLKADALFQEHNPDVVVLDVFMPDKDGFEVIRDIRKVSESCLVVAISSNEGYLPTIKALGATLALHKTIMPEEIVEAVKALLD